MDVHIVIVDNGDTEPELWAFASGEKAEAFAAVRSDAGIEVQSLGVLTDDEADEAIAHERAI